MLSTRVVGSLVVGLLAVAGPAVAQVRVTPPLASAGPFSAPVVEQGALGEILVVALEKGEPRQDALFYDRTSGAALLVINYGVVPPAQGHYAPTSATPQGETYCFVWLAPGLDLSAVRQDDDARADLVGYQRATGKVFRYYRRGEGCS